MERKEPNGLYFISFVYYDEYKDTDNKAQCLVIAPSYSKAIESIEKDYRWINEITVREWVSPSTFDTGINCIYLPNDQNIIDAIADANEY